MYLLKNTIAGAEQIRNIIHFGGVICDIDFKKTIDKFNEFRPGKDDSDKEPGGVPHAFGELTGPQKQTKKGCKTVSCNPFLFVGLNSS